MKTEAQAIGYKTVESEFLSGRVKSASNVENFMLPLFAIAGLIYFGLIIIPIVELANISGLGKIQEIFKLSDNLSAIRLSIYSSMTTVLLVFLIGTPIAFLTGREKSFASKLIEEIIMLPTVLPPAIAGIGLLLAFGRNGSIGGILNRFDLNIVFNPAAVIIAQFFVSAGFYVQVLKVGMISIDKSVIEAAYVQGAGKIDAFVMIILPILKKPVIGGLIIAWTRALGEFGATITFAGNVLDKTRTIPLQAYTLVQTDITMAAALSLVLLLLSFIMLLLVKFWLGE